MKMLLETKWLRLGLAAIATLVIAIFALAGAHQSDWIAPFFQNLIFTYLALVAVRSVFFFFGAFMQKFENYRLNKIPTHEFQLPMVSVIMPCFNEEAVIAQSMRSLSELDYPNLEIIIVNDGSQDATLGYAQVLSHHIANAPVQVLTQINSGKANALNLGLIHARGELILCVDADSQINRDGIEAAVRHFEDPKVGAVAGFIEIANQKSVLLLLQQMEYLVGLNFSRRAMAFLGIVPIVPGPAGLFRRQALIEAGGFIPNRNIFAEDAELSLRIIARGWKVKTEEELIATTEAPASHEALLRQRYRWTRGTYQALILNFNSLIQSGIRGRWVAMHLFLESVVSPVLNFALILYFLTFYFSTGRFEMFTIWYFYLLGIDLMTTLLAVHRHGRWGMWMILTVFNKFYYFYMLLTWKLLSLYEEWLGVGMEWDKLERRGIELKEAL